jgi:DeoR/GlpR family transcriptional regulator of sugar metabolism
MSQEWTRLASMLVPDRHRTLLDEVRRRGSAQVAQLAAAVGVSSSTVRRDLAVLEAEGLLLRARGGAYVRPAAVPTLSTPPAGPTSDDDAQARVRVGHSAAELVEDGMTVMILAGSTTGAMLPLLADRTLTVVTNGLGVAQALAPHPEITLVMLGGVLHREQMTLLGPMTSQNMADLHVDVLFAGAYGVHPEVGVTGSKVTQAGDHHLMLRHATSLVVLATAEKLGRQGPTLLARTEQVDTFITDDAAEPDLVEALRARGSTVRVC